MIPKGSAKIVKRCPALLRVCLVAPFTSDFPISPEKKSRFGCLLRPVRHLGSARLAPKRSISRAEERTSIRASRYGRGESIPKRSPRDAEKIPLDRPAPLGLPLPNPTSPIRVLHISPEKSPPLPPPTTTYNHTAGLPRTCRPAAGHLPLQLPPLPWTPATCVAPPWSWAGPEADLVDVQGPAASVPSSRSHGCHGAVSDSGRVSHLQQHPTPSPICSFATPSDLQQTHLLLTARASIDQSLWLR